MYSHCKLNKVKSFSAELVCLLSEHIMTLVSDSLARIQPLICHSQHVLICLPPSSVITVDSFECFGRDIMQGDSIVDLPLRLSYLLL